MYALVAVAVLAAKFDSLSTPAFIVCFAFLQFFFNFGANTYVSCAVSSHITVEC